MLANLPIASRGRVDREGEGEPEQRRGGKLGAGAVRTSFLYDGHLVRRRWGVARVKPSDSQFDKLATDKMSVVHGENGCRLESVESVVAFSLYDGHLVRRGWSRNPIPRRDSSLEARQSLVVNTPLYDGHLVRREHVESPSSVFRRFHRRSSRLVSGGIERSAPGTNERSVPGTDWLARHPLASRPGRRLRLGGKRGGLGKQGCWWNDQCLALIGVRQARDGQDVRRAWGERMSA